MTNVEINPPNIFATEQHLRTILRVVASVFFVATRRAVLRG